MPEAINLDIYANGIMFSDGRGVYPDIATEHSNADNDAIAAILQEGEKYARRMFEQSYEYQAAKARWENECEQARLEGKPLPPRPSTLDFNSALFPDYCNAEIVKHKISKSMNITVSNQTNNYAVSYKIIYQCNWASGESSTCQYNIMDIKFPRAVNNLYLFYIPTDFKLETINIKNKTPDHGINFFLAKQGEVGNIPEITINLDKDDNIKVYTNIDSPSLKLNDKGIYYPEKITVNIVESKQKDRIYSVEIKLYKYGATPEGKYKEELYSLISTVSKEN